MGSNLELSPNASIRKSYMIIHGKAIGAFEVRFGEGIKNGKIA